MSAFSSRGSLVTLALALVVLVPTASIAAAQVPATTPADSLAVFSRPNGALLRPGTLRYQLSLRKADGQVVPLGTRTVVVTDSALGGAPGWLIAESRTGTVVETSDSVYLARADLTPERWSATSGSAQFGASFTRDTMYGAVQSYQGRASFSVQVPPGALLSAGMTERIAELLPLQLGYHAAAALVLVDAAAPRAVPAELVVDRDEVIDVAGLKVECWVLSLRSGAIEERLWVSKQGSRVSRTEQATTEGLLISVLQP